MINYLFRHLSQIFRIADYFVINIFLYVTNIHFFPERKSGLFITDYSAQFIIVNFSWFFVTTFTKLYVKETLRDSLLQFYALTKSYFAYILFFLIYLFLVFAEDFNYKKFSIYFFLVGVSFSLIRIIFFMYRKKNRFKVGRKLFKYNTVLIGESHYSKLLLSNKELRRYFGIRELYFVEEKYRESNNSKCISQFFKDLDRFHINNIVLCDNRIDIELYHKIIDIAEHKMIRIYMVSDFKNKLLSSYYLEIIHDVPFLKLIKEPLSSPGKQFLKRTFDFLFSLFVTIFLLSWLIPIVAIIIKLESKGPVFFVQKRSGLKNEAFGCIKFRSMAVNEKADLQIAKKNDSRVTKFGAFMRKTSIDELPQFLNVLVGNMSIVGPRPHMLSQTEQYSKITKKYMTRHIVKPGITGWAQVMGARGEIFSDQDMQKRIEKDIWYIQHWSFFLDIKIIFLTFYNVVKGDKQAY
ncbi:exopolysaccharide biosynthesis polyprenyl glycosylphosphotransferase [Epilithonimonas hominis]|uniref:exopolysaccharide biosynthesis polyprenyl glycosylphosphotransferase n=1 Tax=Epilithonimonas hominis TaxID=420404 RepID=UPI00289D7512|nr:exopolysaccharide biosynthesis polyprenyl glycosylphosphotransferase [Epilithonimonas hominis]